MSFFFKKRLHPKTNVFQIKDLNWITEDLPSISDESGWISDECLRFTSKEIILGNSFPVTTQPILIL
jgi:hypothetical protein